MSSFRGLTLARRQKILDRQDPPGWGEEYVPSILATREEAPSISRAVQLWAKQLGRSCHLLSKVEVRAATLALYHPALFELHEQRMLSSEPRPHPLANHPRYAGLNLSPLRGTLDVAQRLGVLSVIPLVRFTEDNERHLAPFPLVGDLLLFLVDSQGPYCVNWPLKDTRKAFRRPGPKPRAKPRPDVDDPNAIARNELEIAYYQDAGIRTEQLSREDINPAVAHNLYDLFLAHRKAIDISDDARREATEDFVDVVGTSTPAYRVLQHVERKLALSKEDAIALLKQAIWRRDVRVDLFKPVLMDRPLAGEMVDVLDTYAAWFAR